MQNSTITRFKDLNIHLGQVVQLYPDGQKQESFDVVLFGYIPGQAIIIGEKARTEFPLVQEGQRILLKVLTDNGLAVFSTTILFMTNIPVLCLYLDVPEEIKYKQIRKNSRINVAIPILCSNSENTSIRGVPGKIIDISPDGAKLEVFENAGEVGDAIEIKGKFTIGDIQRTMSLSAVLRGKKPLKNDSIHYGVEFMEGDEDKIITLFGFIFNAMNTGDVQRLG